MPNLFPSTYETEVIEAADLEASQPTGYRPGVAFDYELGDFPRDGRNRLLDSTGVESWKAWCYNAISTERYKHLAYSTDFGIELDKVFAAESRAEAESILTREITESLLADPYERTEYISNIEYDWTAPDSVMVKVTVKGIQEVSIDLEAYLTREE